MKRVYTSNYARNGKHEHAYCISVYGPDWYDGKYLSFLAPERKTVYDYKSGKITETEYIQRYLNHITRDGQTPQDLYDKIPEGAILLCYESPHEFCHRRVFAEWIKHHLNIDIPEILTPDEVNQLKQQEFVDSILDFL